MSDIFRRAFAIVIGEEGGFQKNPKDRGNWTGGKTGVGELRGTKYGISAAAYPKLDIEHLTLDQARLIYLNDYFAPARCNLMPWQWALPVFDCAVNQGVGIAPRLLQDALGVLVDGKVGPKTLAALASSNDRHIARFFKNRVRRYEQHPDYDYWGDGWLTRLFVIAAEAAKA